MSDYYKYKESDGTERVLMIEMLGVSQPIVVDIRSREALCILVGKRYRGPDGFHRYSIYQPVEFKTYQAAKDFCEGKITIADIQEGTSCLQVKFTDKLIEKA